jgi:WD40 repeat protein
MFLHFRVEYSFLSCSWFMWLFQVIVKDFVSRAIISQFKAHSSPISALCFDPSGTLLVTASVYGNNINIFRIMPSSARKGSGVSSCDWSTTHAHLYRLHRGITPAVSIS